MEKKRQGLHQRWERMYRRSSIQMILSLSFTAVAVIGMLFLGMALLFRFSSSANSMAADNTRRILTQVNLNLDRYLHNMMQVSDTVYYRVIKNADLSQQKGREELQDALELLYAKDRDVLVSLAIFEGDGSLVAATPLADLKNSVSPHREDWFTSAMERIENLHFSTPHVQNLFVDPDNRYHWVVSISRQVELTRGGGTQSGLLLVDMNFSRIEQICKDVGLANGQGYLYLIDGDGEIIYHPRQQLIYAGLQEENNLTAAGYPDGTHTETFHSQRRQVTIKTVGYTGWKLVGVVPEETLRDNFSQLLWFAMFMVFFSIFLLVFVNLRLSEWITAPMKKLDRAVRELEKGRETVDFDVSGPYEIAHLSRSIQSMVSTMRHLMDDILQQEEEKRRSELNVLQSQINPHFLYNTLDSVVWMTENGRTQEAVIMLTALARFSASRSAAAAASSRWRMSWSTPSTISPSKKCATKINSPPISRWSRGWKASTPSSSSSSPSWKTPSTTAWNMPTATGSSMSMPTAAAGMSSSRSRITAPVCPPKWWSSCCGRIGARRPPAPRAPASGSAMSTKDFSFTSARITALPSSASRITAR